MILVVDDDGTILSLVEQTLKAEGYAVRTAGGAAAALEASAGEAPELVISDIMMPEMGGFEFRQEYVARHPTRQTPFIFLSSLSDDENIVKGLDLGADDYLIKPVSAPVLKAKVRAVLRRRRREGASSFHGDLEKLPFINLLKFCELKALTGDVEVKSGDLEARIRFSAGVLEMDEKDEEQLDRLYDLEAGTFVIRSRPVDFVEIEEAAAPADAAAEAVEAAAEKPMGQLSGVRANSRLFQIQTEFASGSVVTIVTLDGKTVLKKKGEAPAGAGRAEAERLIREQHRAVEEEVRRKISSAAKKKAETGESARERFNRLFDEGYDRYRENDYAGALAVWREAEKIDPENKTLRINMQIVNKKLEAGG